MLTEAVRFMEPGQLPRSWQHTARAWHLLGLWEPQQGLTALGRAVLLARGPLPAAEPRPWHLYGDRLVVPCPTDWAAWAQLEHILGPPMQPGVYRLRPARLSALRAQGHGPALLALLRRMVADPLPSALRAALTEEPQVGYRAGVVFVFAHEGDFRRWLARTREGSPFAVHFLAPGKVLVPHAQAAAFRRYLEEDLGLRALPLPPEAIPRTPQVAHLSPQADPEAGLREAIALGQDIVLRYRDAQGRVTRRRVTPLALEDGADGPLMWAFCHQRRAPRRFYLHRIEGWERA